MPNLVNKSLSTSYGNIIYYWFESEEPARFNLFIHGLGGNRKWFPSDFENFKLNNFSWIVPDLMGHGDSSKGRFAEVYTMDQQAEFLLKILESEGVLEIVILAHSMGGPIAISLIEKLANQKEQQIKVSGLFYLEGNLDAGDAFISSRINTIPFDEFEVRFDSWCTELLAGTSDPYFIEWVGGLREAGSFAVWESSKDCAYLSKRGDLLQRLTSHLKFPVYFIFGGNNKGQNSSESLVREAGLPIHFIPNAGHAMFRENPSDFWTLVTNLLRLPDTQN